MKLLPIHLLKTLYGSDKTTIAYQKKRYENLIETFSSHYTISKDDSSIRLFSSPGRTEIAGNHTDHNNGKVLGASINLDCIAAVKKTDDSIISIFDTTYNENYTINVLDTKRKKEDKGSKALIKGIIEGFKNEGFKVGGFKSCFTSDVIAAAGVSSSASFEMIICCILSNLFNEGTISIEKFAAIGQYAENAYWDKASGQLDQMACAVGGMIHIDFKNPKTPRVNKISFDFEKENYSLIITNTGSSHADLSAEYSSIPEEMKNVAKFFNQKTLRELKEENLIESMHALRSACGDRAVMRALHFYEENKRVDEEKKALEKNDFSKFLKLITESGNSSWKWLQNVYLQGNPTEEPIALCLALSELFIKEKKTGACRIHGGGFAGVIVAFIPNALVDEYTKKMENILGYCATTEKTSPVYRMKIRPRGCIEIA